MGRSLQPLRPSSQSAKIARRKEFGQNLISLIHEIDKRVENQMWQETVNYVPLISYLVDLMGVIGNFNSQISSIQVQEELNEMSNYQSLSHHYILSRFAEITGLMIIVMDAETTDCTIYGPMNLLVNCGHQKLSDVIEGQRNKWKFLPFILLRRKYRKGSETEHYIHIALELWNRGHAQLLCEKFHFSRVKNSHMIIYRDGCDWLIDFKWFVNRLQVIRKNELVLKGHLKNDFEMEYFDSSKEPKIQNSKKIYTDIINY